MMWTGIDMSAEVLVADSVSSRPQIVPNSIELPMDDEANAEEENSRGIEVTMDNEVSVEEENWVNLDEFVVEGRTQRVVKNGVEYMPDKKIKEVSVDAQSLLRNMMIPQLNVSVYDNSIKTVSGAEVSMFIDYIPSEKGDLVGLRPEDVVRVEVLDYPQDPRFGGKDHVVNFVMKRREWGGYTKLTAQGKAFVDQMVGGMLYNKFNVRNLTVDLYASADGRWQTHPASYSHEIFRDIRLDNRYYQELTRESQTDKHHSKNDSEVVTLRLSWHKEKSYISHTLGFLRDGQPYASDLATVRFYETASIGEQTARKATQQSISLSAAGDYYFTFPAEQALTVNWAFSHSSNNSNSLYAYQNDGTISTDAREKSYNPDLTVYYTKSFSGYHTLRLMLSSYANFYNTRYAGSYNGLQKLISNENLFFAEYMKEWECGVSLYTRLGASYVLGRINGQNKVHEWSPRLGIMAQYQINSMNSVNFDAFWANSHPSPSIANDAKIRVDECMWHVGNPDLKNIYGPLLSASYTLIPDNRWSLTALLKYQRYFHMYEFDYRPNATGDGMVRGFSGDYDEELISGSVVASLRLMGNKLVLNAQGEIAQEKILGLATRRLTSLRGMAQAMYNFGRASVALFYESPSKHLLAHAGEATAERCSYGVQASCMLGRVKVNLAYSNWFNSGRTYTDYSSVYYTSRGWQWSASKAPALNLTVSYTLNYGKKVEASDEIERAAYKNSAILE